jgi:tetratricopeptide (TPR) repeat protein
LERLARGEAARGIRLLERANLLAPDNTTLLSFIGEHFFSFNRMALARDYLGRAFQITPTDGVSLLLALAFAEEGDTQRATELLGALVKRGHSSFAAHYALGKMYACHKLWADALFEFKRALSFGPSVEAHYALGAVNYQLSRNRVAARHLSKALEINRNYTEAYYLLGLIHLRTGEIERAEEALNTACDQEGKNKFSQAKVQRMLKQGGTSSASAPLFSTGRVGGKRLVTGGDKKLAKVLIENALEVLRAAEEED